MFLPPRPSAYSRALSVALIPPVVATATFTYLILQVPSVHSPFMVWLMSVLCSGLLMIPYVLLQRKRLKDFDAPQRESRTRPYLVSSVFSFAGFFGLMALGAPIIIAGLMWCYAVNTVLLLLINLRWKISAHMMGFTGPLTYLIPLLGSGLLWFAPVALALGWARVRSGTHNVPEVLAGAAAGISLTALQLLFLQPYG